MTGAGPTAAQPTADRVPPDAHEAAVARYRSRMRPWRAFYAAALVLAVIAVLAVVRIAYDHGEISHATLHTVAASPSGPKFAAPAASLTRAWSSADTTAVGTPYFEGTVITHDAHTVRGRDAATGRQTWAYTRTDRSVCAAMQDDGTTVAVYRLHGSCDELTALNSSTGAREWTRTLDKDTAEFNGPASFAVQPGTFFLVSSTSIYAIADGGLDYWTFHHFGCTIDGAVLGQSGALISQTCRGEQCNGAKFCGNGRQLLLRDPTKGYDDNSSTNKNNPDQIIWNRFGSDLVPTDAGQQVAARDPSGTALQLLNTQTGKPGARLPLAPGVGSGAPSAVTACSDADLIWVGGRSYALPAGAEQFAWQAATSSPVTAFASDGSSAPPLQQAELSVADASGIELLDPATGTPRRTIPVGALPSGSTAYPFGDGFVVAGSRTSVYR